MANPVSNIANEAFDQVNPVSGHLMSNIGQQTCLLAIGSIILTGGIGPAFAAAAGGLDLAIQGLQFVSSGFSLAIL